jgi:myo-inositol 2-dehydrogenase / D-chiro-inositol 1-dehydrogenase
MTEKGPGGGMNRREFVGLGAVAGMMIVAPQLVTGTAANSAPRLGLLGCGGRGTADAKNMITYTPARLVALADLFPDQLEKAKSFFDGLNGKLGHPSIERKQMFRGPNSYEDIINSKEVDVVLITTPPYFHAQHLAAVVSAGKHVYCEKPVAVDVDGAKRVIEIGTQADGRLSLEVGFQIRKAPPFVELVRRIHGGALGSIACGDAYYYATPINRPSWPGASAVEVRLRNWIYDRVLSGDILVEQDIHVVDTCNWILQAHPVKAIAKGGRAYRTDSGDAWGHYNVVFEYPNGVHVTLNSTQFDKGWWDVNERFFGSKGVSESHYSGPVAIYGDEPWSWNTNRSPLHKESTKFSQSGAFHDNLAEADSEKQKSFVASITSGRFHNQAALGAESTLSAMLGRTAAYENREISWDELLKMDMHWESHIDLKQFA